jgi:hypothetical protein
MLGIVLLVLAWVSVPLPAWADLTGRASVIDGGRIEIHGQLLPLHGIDAKTWDAGQPRLADNARDRRSGTCITEPSLLAGPLRDECGNV